jgi:hypothetical protein
MQEYIEATTRLESERGIPEFRFQQGDKSE